MEELKIDVGLILQRNASTNRERYFIYLGKTESKMESLKGINILRPYFESNQLLVRDEDLLKDYDWSDSFTTNCQVKPMDAFNYNITGAEVHVRDEESIYPDLIGGDFYIIISIQTRTVHNLIVTVQSKTNGKLYTYSIGRDSKKFPLFWPNNDVYAKLPKRSFNSTNTKIQVTQAVDDLDNFINSL